MAYSNAVQSVVRVMDIIIEIGNSATGITLRELANRLNLKSPTLHNLLRTLKMRGFVRQCPEDSQYVLGSTLFDLTTQYRQSALLAVAEDAVRSLHKAMDCKATITFVEQIGGGLQTVLRMSPDQPWLLQKPNQVMLNQCVSATALVFRAFGSDDERETMENRHPFQELAGPFVNKPEQYNALIALARKQGYACHAVEYPDQFSVAAPLLGENKRLLGALGASFKNVVREEIELLRAQAINALLKTTQTTPAGLHPLRRGRAPQNKINHGDI